MAQIITAIILVALALLFAAIKLIRFFRSPRDRDLCSAEKCKSCPMNLDGASCDDVHTEKLPRDLN